MGVDGIANIAVHLKAFGEQRTNRVVVVGMHAFADQFSQLVAGGTKAVIIQAHPFVERSEHVLGVLQCKWHGRMHLNDPRFKLGAQDKP